VRSMPQYTELEHQLDLLLSDGKRHSFAEIRKVVREHYDDSQLSNANVTQAVKRLRKKMRTLEPQCEVVNTFAGYKGYWRKFRRLDDS